MRILGIFLLSTMASLAYPAAIPTNLVEVYFVVDQQVVNRYMEEQSERSEAVKALNDDIDYFITEINEMYASLKPKGLSIGLGKLKVDILEYNLFTENQDVDPGLKAFDNWLDEQKAHDNLKYDAALFWTGFELVSNSNKGIAGYAHVGEVCTSKATGIAEYDLTYNLAVIAAHEIGHILGASHDSVTTTHVMVPSGNAIHSNRWDFSICSMEAFQAVISKLSTNCMANTAPGTTVPNVDASAALLDPDVICRRSQKDQTSYMCKGSNFYKDESELCKRIWCKDTSSYSSNCRGAYSSDGLICGTNKRCNDGVCESHADSESGAVDDNCIYGDQKQIYFNTNKGPYSGDCAGFIAQLGKGICKDDNVKSVCCKTCGGMTTGIPGCEFGDTYPSCGDYTQAQICDNYRDICCQFCHGYKKKRSTDQHTSTIKLDTSNMTVTNMQSQAPPPKPEDRPLHNEA